MTVEEGVVEKKDEKKTVLVGIRINKSSRESLNWALAKVAEPGDRVVALHVYHDSNNPHVKENFSAKASLLDGYLAVYEGFCNVKKVELIGQVSQGNSIRKVLVKEAKLCSATVVVVGVTKCNALGGSLSLARYCAKKLPTTTVLAIHNGKVVFCKDMIKLLTGPDQQDSPLTEKDDVIKSDENRSSSSSAFHSTVQVEMPEEDEKHSHLSQEQMDRVSSCSISLLMRMTSEYTPGWPLLQRATSETLEILSDAKARKMTVVQWVMSLPNRSLPLIPQSQLDSETYRREILEGSDKGIKSSLSTWFELLKELKTLLRTNSPSCRIFSRKELQSLIIRFSPENLIGKGGCSWVYKGHLPNGEPVAVKISKSSKEVWKDFLLEIDIISSLQHKHIVPLIGVCVEDSDLISVYKFLSKGSLEENLHGKGDKSVLPWEVRYKVAVGVAEALSYLHSECSRPVIHRDIKSSNILLSDEFEAQLSDFGLALWAPTTSPNVTDSDVVGTFGYLAPEYLMYGKVSNKIDVYSYAVVLLELLSGRKPISSESPKGQESLVIWATPKLESGDTTHLLDPKLAGEFDENQMQQMVLAATLCITRTAQHRPQMSQILKLLQGDKDIVEWAKTIVKVPQESGNQDEEVYPVSGIKSHHLDIALLEMDDDITSASSVEQNSNHPLEDYLQSR